MMEIYKPTSTNTNNFSPTKTALAIYISRSQEHLFAGKICGSRTRRHPRTTTQYSTFRITCTSFEQIKSRKPKYRQLLHIYIQPTVSVVNTDMISTLPEIKQDIIQETLEEMLPKKRAASKDITQARELFNQNHTKRKRVQIPPTHVNEVRSVGRPTRFETLTKLANESQDKPTIFCNQLILIGEKLS